MGADRMVDATANADADRQVKAAARQAWGLGDYHRFAKATIWEVGPVLVEACGISPGQRVLDVAAGTGNAAIRAAQAGATVVASDLTPENFEAGRREAAAQKVDLDWVEADAEALPFADGEFDVVTSSFGAIFAPNHQTVADEMLRVCRPGGTIGMLNFTPEGLISDFFAALAPYMPPPPPGAMPPPLWGSEEHVRDLFADRVESLEMSRRHYVERGGQPARLPRTLQADVRAGRRDIHETRGRSRPRRLARPRLPGLRDAREQRTVRRGRGVPIRVSAGGCAGGRRVGSGRQPGPLLSRESRSTASDEKTIRRAKLFLHHEGGVMASATLPPSRRFPANEGPAVPCRPAPR